MSRGQVVGSRGRGRRCFAGDERPKLVSQCEAVSPRHILPNASADERGDFGHAKAKTFA